MSTLKYSVHILSNTYMHPIGLLSFDLVPSGNIHSPKHVMSSALTRYYRNHSANGGLPLDAQTPRSCETSGAKSKCSKFTGMADAVR